MVDSKAIGDIRFVDIKLRQPLVPIIVGQSDNLENWRTKPEVAGGGYFYDLASHQLDYLDFLFGPIIRANGMAKSMARGYQAEDTTLGTFEFETGVMGTGTWCFVASPESEIEETTIYGSKGSITFPFFTGTHVVLKIDGEKEQRFEFEMPKHIQQPLIQRMVDELNGKGKCPSTGVSGARTNWVMEQICQRVDL